MACELYNSTCPLPGDQSVNLLGKILQVLNNGGGGGGAGVSAISVNGGPNQTGVVGLTIPPALLNFTDENADADAVVWRNSGATEVFRAVGASGFVQFQTTGTAMRLHTTSVLTDSFTFLATNAKADGAFLEVYGTGHPTGLGGATVSIHDGGQYRIRSAPVASTTSVLRATLDGTTGNFGIGPSTTPAAHLQINGATSQTSWTTVGSAFSSAAATHTDSSSTTVAVRAANSFGTPTFSSPSASTVTDAFNLYVAVPLAGGSLTATRLSSAYFEGRVGIGTTSPSTFLDIVGGNGILHSTVSTDATLKSGRIGVRHYNNADLPFYMFVANANSAGNGNQLYLGGGTSIGNAATQIRFYTAANYQTTTGSIRGFIDSAGLWGIGPSKNPTFNLDIQNGSTPTSVAIHETGDGLASPANYSRLILQTQAGNHLIRTQAAGMGLTAGKPRTLQVGCGVSVGTDITGQDFILHAGQSTGSAIGGSILFQSSAAGGSGTTSRSLETVALINSLGSMTIRATTATPAGGSAGAGLQFGTSTNFGVFYGSGAPTVTAAKGSLYLRSDGTGTGDRAYINTDGSTTWTALTTAA